MTTAVVSPTEMLDRIAQIERQQGRLRTLGLALLGLAGLQVGVVATALLLTWPHLVGTSTTGRRVLEAERVVLRDADGRLRGDLGADDAGVAGLNFYDKEGVRRLRLGPTGLYLSDSRGTVQASLRLMAGGTPDEPFVPVLRLSDGQGSPRSSIVVHRNGSSAVLLTNAEGHAGVALESAPDGSGHLAMSGRGGTRAAWLGALPDDSRALMLSDAAGSATAMLSVVTGGAAQLSLSDRAGRERIGASVLPDGSPHVELTGAGGRGVATLGVTPSGAPVLELSAPDGEAGATLLAAGASAALHLRDRAGTNVAGLDTDAGRWPRLFLSGEGGRVASMLTVSPDGAPSLGLFDARGRARAFLGQFTLGSSKGKAFAHRGAPFALTFFNETGDVIRKAPR